MITCTNCGTEVYDGYAVILTAKLFHINMALAFHTYVSTMLKRMLLCGTEVEWDEFLL